ncbi:hypothetical protein FTO74_10675 [Granulicella sp. WH15]|uniref:hypothetical protein n=1 Tax=Granulicella sp. WH15 TaxID=2602070 RepID=UPI0013675947|nr:hypothetical protein [Granulicella sp. WH15]QHN03785.1 hypothetical protein FTO74_10675 [Granulicella sp. WH15]
MKLRQSTAFAAFLMTLHLHCQMPAPSPQTTGPTMDQTINFINEAFSKPISLAWEYENRRGVSEVSAQHVSVSENCTLRYTYRFQYSIDMESLKRGTGHPQSESVLLQNLDPLSIQIEEERAENARSTPPIFHVTIKQLATQERQANNITTGYFTERDSAQRVAKAYIHAIVLCHKPEAPSIF